MLEQKTFDNSKWDEYINFDSNLICKYKMVIMIHFGEISSSGYEKYLSGMCEGGGLIIKNSTLDERKMYLELYKKYNKKEDGIEKKIFKNCEYYPG